MTSHQLSRRQFLKVGAFAAGTGLLAACTAPGAAPAATGGQAAPAAVATSIVVWYQDWDGANRIMKAAKEQRAKDAPNVTIELTPSASAISWPNYCPRLRPAPKAMC